MGERATIRPVRPDDLAALYEIALATGDSGQDAAALYRALDAVVALYYNDPAGFDDVRRYAISINGSYFTTERMVREYAINAYGEAALPGTGNVAEAVA